ncbi:MaoC family dehydratase N-terminal domain-containing protein [Peribacillus asahii]|uniref:FAS1-like dehydratase domain-containing protein n=1 Tax=Peribacillus asahii TaxID=228899 RepID=UPI0038057EBA
MESLSTGLQEKVGMKLDTYNFKIEKGKIRELALAIGDLREESLKGELILPTFPTVVDFLGEETSTLEDLLGLNLQKVLHGEQEYEYLGEMKPGDNLTVTGVIENVYTKAAMDFFIIKKEFVNQHGETVLISRSTIIERH